VLQAFNLYDLFVLCFVQLVVSTMLILSPARHLRTQLSWTGSKVTEVFLAGAVASALASLSGLLSVQLWGLDSAGVEIAACVLVLISLAVIVVRPGCDVTGQVFYASYAAAGFTFLFFAANVAAAATQSFGEAITSSGLILLDLGAFMIWNSNMSYVSDVFCRTRHSRPPARADTSYQPMVSLHIPTHNEPPELLIETIKAVERVDYPDFEIIVIDNNTTDPAVWRPVEEYCRDRPGVRFVHVENLSGYKAGACNLALRRHTDPRAEIIGLVDADDIVVPHYLRETVGYFCDPKIGFVQTFEGNRDYEGSSYYTACVDSYQGFYLANMSSRNERDSIPFVGTMGMFRRSALERIGGWNEWCISEDTEASLRALKAGWSGLYIPRCFGRGVVPPTFGGFLTQHYRWCFGAMQILRLHWRSLMPWDRAADNHLSSAQRRDYLMASVAWMRDLMMVAFTLVLLAMSGLLLTGSDFAFTPLAGARSLLPVSLVVIATICMTSTLRHWTTLSLRRSLKALLISLSSSWITALACAEGLSRREGVFKRTSKTRSSHHRLRTALRLSRCEILLTLALFTAAGLLAARARPPVLFIIIISTQGLVYASAPAASLWNVRAGRATGRHFERRVAGPRGLVRIRHRSWATAGVTTGALVAVAVGTVFASLAAPSRLLPGTHPTPQQAVTITYRTESAPK
jgi:cellulose synthase/poly-beta-1,6-N-acetylglucosamine synthase-like glycosyltransferase